MSIRYEIRAATSADQADLLELARYLDSVNLPNDAATIAHFGGLRLANIKGSRTILHEEAASRIEHVQAEIGEAAMPSSGGVGWPVSSIQFLWLLARP